MINAESLFFNPSSVGGGTPPAGCTGLVDSIDPFGDGSLVAKYQLDGDATDLTGTYNGTAYNVTYSSSDFGSKAIFNGTTGYIALPTGMPNGMISFFGTIPDIANRSYFIGGSLAGSDDVFGWFNDVDGGVLLLGNDTDGQQLKASFSPIANRVYHFAIETTQTPKIYVDGILVGSTTFTSNFSSSSNAFVGRWRSLYKPSTVDQLEFYNRALTADEVYDLYTQSNYCSDPVPDFIAHYPLTGTAEDVTGVYDGTENGGLTYVDDATRGSVANFDGVNDCSTTSLPKPSYPFSVSMWVNLDAQLDTNSAYDFGGAKLVFQTDGTVVWDSSGLSSSFPILTASTFVHCVVIHTGDVTRKLYIDSVGQSGTVSNKNNNYSSTNFMLGCRGNGSTPYSSYINGNISNVRVYDRTLTATEVSDIYNYEKQTRNIPVDDGLIAYYPLDTNSMDNYYNQYDGTDTSVTYDGISALFDGVNDYINLGFVQPATDLTYSIWFKSSASTSNMGAMASITSDGNQYPSRGGIVFGGGKFYASVSNGSVTWYDFTSLNISSYLDGSWHLCNTVLTGKSYKVYMDGVEIHEYTTTIAIGTVGSENIHIGRWGSYNGYYFNGNLSNARLYNRAISQAEVTAIYNAELAEHTV